MTIDGDDAFGFRPDEVTTGAPTRAARLKWVVVVDKTLATGLAANAVACVAAATGPAVANMIGPVGTDAEGGSHPGLPWIGCTILGADAVQLAQLHAKAAAAEGVLVVDMPAFAQETVVYDEYLAALGATKAADLTPLAVSVVGARNTVSKLVKRLALLR